jgi:DNA topoisomerase III
MKSLIIAEKPSVMRDIAAALNSKFGPFKKDAGFFESSNLIVSSCIGHLVELSSTEATPGATLPIIPEIFDLSVIERTKDQYKLVKQLMARNDVNCIINACDAGREGELIFRLVFELSKTKKETKRMWLQSMTQEAIVESFNAMKPGAEYDDLADAARSRAEADWLVGINGSRSLSKIFKRPTNVGRVMTPTLAMIVDRQKEIEDFTPVSYSEVHALFKLQAGEYTAKWQNPAAKNGEHAERCSKEVAESIIQKCTGKAPSSVIDESKSITQPPPKLFDLTTLQRDANVRFGMSAKETLDCAQALYETHKALSYPRTDASALPEDYVEKAVLIVKSFEDTEFGSFSKKIIDNDRVKPIKRIFNNEKISDHFAIIPTGVKPHGLSEPQRKIYEIVTRRFLAAFFPDVEQLATTRTTVLQGERFKSSGRVLVNAGWEEVYGKEETSEEDSNLKLCKYTQGEMLSPGQISLKELKTKPLKAFTEATLLAAMASAGKTVDDEELAAAMKEKGIGTPATRAATIEKLLDAKDGKGNAKEPFLIREKKNLVATKKGVDLIEFLKDQKLDSLTSASATGQLEKRLSLVESGSVKRLSFMTEIHSITRNTVSVIESQAHNQMQKMTASCPKCGGRLSIDSRQILCATPCGYKLWREVAKRGLSVQECEFLIFKKEIGPLDGFVSSKTGKKFSAKLVMSADDFSLKFQFQEAAVAKLSIKCPKCGADLSESHVTIACEKKCGFVLWKTVAQRPLTSSECKILITKGEVGPLNGLTSSSGKKFAATLMFDENFKTSFRF